MQEYQEQRDRLAKEWQDWVYGSAGGIVGVTGEFIQAKFTQRRNFKISVDDLYHLMESEISYRSLFYQFHNTAVPASGHLLSWVNRETGDMVPVFILSSGEALFWMACDWCGSQDHYYKDKNGYRLCGHCGGEIR